MKSIFAVFITCYACFSWGFSQELPNPTDSLAASATTIIVEHPQRQNVSPLKLDSSDPSAALGENENDGGHPFDPNLIPYRSRRSVFSHMLALPSYAWNAFWYPIGVLEIRMEQGHGNNKLLSWLFNDDFTAGIFPIAKFGGTTGTEVGIRAYHDNLFNQKKKLHFTFLYHSTDDNTAHISYTDPAFLGKNVKMKFTAGFFNDSNENHFVGGNESRQSDRTSYAETERSLWLDLSYPVFKSLHFDIDTKIERFDIEQSDESTFGDLFPIDIPGIGTSILGSVGAALTLDLRRGWPRVLSGLLIRTGYDFNSEFSGIQHQFHHYFAEMQSYFSLPFLARNRRFAARFQFNKVEEAAGKDIPFYKLSILGNSRTLRGFDQYRFRGEGSLLFNIEYHYPIFDYWDAVIFWDEGQVFNEFEQIRLDSFHRSVGFGFRFMSKNRFLFRLEFGFSNEKKPRALLRLTPSF